MLNQRKCMSKYVKNTQHPVDTHSAEMPLISEMYTEFCVRNGNLIWQKMAFDHKITIDAKNFLC